MALSTIGTNSIADDAVTVAKATGFGKVLQQQFANFNLSGVSKAIFITSVWEVEILI